MLALPELLHGDDLYHVAARTDQRRLTIFVDKRLVRNIFIMLGWTL